MPRNAEVIRQWNVLRELEASRRATISGLAQKMDVTTRTIRRDLEALQVAGFPIFDELVDGKRFWKLDTKPFR
ncbi:MAG: transcriptional regulator, partial [Acidobacteria bacterium]|nr:transcriptional regulator [Acidobacteriota bacterium]